MAVGDSRNKRIIIEDGIIVKLSTTDYPELITDIQKLLPDVEILASVVLNVSNNLNKILSATSSAEGNDEKSNQFHSISQNLSDEEKERIILLGMAQSDLRKVAQLLQSTNKSIELIKKYSSSAASQIESYLILETLSQIAEPAANEMQENSDQIKTHEEKLKAERDKKKKLADALANAFLASSAKSATEFYDDFEIGKKTGWSYSLFMASIRESSRGEEVIKKLMHSVKGRPKEK